MKGNNSAYLIDGNTAPLRLTCKRCGDYSRRDLYTPSPIDADTAVMHRSVGFTALVCDDAGTSEPGVGQNQRPTLDRIERLGAAHNLLCIPAHMTITGSLDVARRWATSITVVLANACTSQPSVIIHEGREVISQDQYQDQNDIQLCDL